MDHRRRPRLERLLHVAPMPCRCRRSRGRGRGRGRSRRQIEFNKLLINLLGSHSVEAIRPKRQLINPVPDRIPRRRVEASGVVIHDTVLRWAISAIQIKVTAFIDTDLLVSITGIIDKLSPFHFSRIRTPIYIGTPAECGPNIIQFRFLVFWNCNLMLTIIFYILLILNHFFITFAGRSSASCRYS